MISSIRLNNQSVYIQDWWIAPQIFSLSQVASPATIPAHAHIPTAIQLSSGSGCVGFVTHVSPGVTVANCPLPITHAAATKTVAAGATKAGLGLGIVKLSLGVVVLVGVSAVIVVAFGTGVYLGASAYCAQANPDVTENTGDTGGTGGTECTACPGDIGGTGGTEYIENIGDKGGTGG